MATSPRQRMIIDAVRQLGGTATLADISQVTGLSVNGLSQTLNARWAREAFTFGNERGGKRTVEIKNTLPVQIPLPAPPKQGKLF